MGSRPLRHFLPWPATPNPSLVASFSGEKRRRAKTTRTLMRNDLSFHMILKPPNSPYQCKKKRRKAQSLSQLFSGSVPLLPLLSHPLTAFLCTFRFATGFELFLNAIGLVVAAAAGAAQARRYSIASHLNTISLLFSATHVTHLWQTHKLLCQLWSDYNADRL